MSSRNRRLTRRELAEMEAQQDMQERGRRLVDYHRRRLTIPEFIDWTPPENGAPHGLP